jgi:hypothetical protein
MCISLYIGVWCECAFVLHISYPKIPKIFYFFEILLCVLTLRSSLNVFDRILGNFYKDGDVP